MIHEGDTIETQNARLTVERIDQDYIEMTDSNGNSWAEDRINVEMAVQNGRWERYD